MYKVGDKVRVLNKGTVVRHYLIVGSPATIYSVEGNGKYYVSGISRNHGGEVLQIIHEKDLMILDSKKEPKPINITSPDDVIIGTLTAKEARHSDVLFMAHLYHGLGMSFRQVAKLTNVHERTVRRRFKKYGIPSRPMNGVK